MNNRKKVLQIGDLVITETKTHKYGRSPGYNFNFDKTNGNFERWGKTYEDDPEYAPINEILDIEIISACKGPRDSEGKYKLCSFCYKSNNPVGHSMTLTEFKNIIDKMPWTLQIALGGDAQGTLNPDMFDMMKYARAKGIIPNLTIADVDDDVATKLVNVAGAVAVSIYKHAGKDTAYNSIYKLTQEAKKQGRDMAINAHFMLSQETMDFAYEVMEDIKTDYRLADLNAIVFLSLKQKGRGTKFDMVTVDDYKKVVDTLLKEGIRFGFDSCSAPAFMKAVEGHEMYDLFSEQAESCESTLFSSYINEKGQFFPCSFTEKWIEGGWATGIDVLKADDFLKDVWNNPKTVKFRNALIGNKDENKCRNCPAFAVCCVDKMVPEKCL